MKCDILNMGLTLIIYEKNLCWDFRVLHYRRKQKNHRRAKHKTVACHHPEQQIQIHSKPSYITNSHNHLKDQKNKIKTAAKGDGGKATNDEKRTTR